MKCAKSMNAFKTSHVLVYFFFHGIQPQQLIYIEIKYIKILIF